jgi:hypothetical protein
LHAKAASQGVREVNRVIPGAPCAGGAEVGEQTIAGPFARWQWELDEPRVKRQTLN